MRSVTGRLHEALIVDAVRSPIGKKNGTLASIRADELYVFTHPEMRGEMDQRFAAIQAAMDKAAAR